MARSPNTIRAKLTRIMMLTSAVSLVLASLSLGVYDWVQYRAGQVRDLKSMADLLSVHTVAAHPASYCTTGGGAGPPAPALALATDAVGDGALGALAVGGAFGGGLRLCAIRSASDSGG